MNHHLAAAEQEPATNFTDDLKDGSRYTHLLN